MWDPVGYESQCHCDNPLTAFENDGLGGLGISHLCYTISAVAVTESYHRVRERQSGPGGL